MVMPQWLILFTRQKPERFGTLLALAGVLILTPDTLIIRLSGLERWTLMGWRGILMGAMSFAIGGFIALANRDVIYAQFSAGRDYL